jgi:hypothetical protein
MRIGHQLGRHVESDNLLNTRTAVAPATGILFDRGQDTLVLESMSWRLRGIPIDT